jgi:bifunctional UDP-N-acetylglucosamine pyrophosphorylase / glucosamine-1-phosphate N-acetyltransferase
MAETTIIVLAAGEGKRMRSATPKVLHSILGRSLVGHVLHAADAVGAHQTLVVVGHGADAVGAHIADIAPKAQTVLQAEQLGTGHAVRIALESAPQTSGVVVVVYGDTPLLRGETLQALVDTHLASGAAATVMTADVADPTGLGRIVRDSDGGLAAIVEQRDASPEQLAITEINAGMYAFDADALRGAIGRLSRQNDQGEEYLTDVIGLLRGDGRSVGMFVVPDADEALGVNDRAQLAALAAIMRDRVNRAWMRSGVTMIDPATTWIDVTVAVAADALIEPNTQLRGSTEIGAHATIGPDTTLTDVHVGTRASVIRTHGSGAWVGEGASVGPYAYLRPGTSLGEAAKIGTFVETKNARIGRSSKVPHLTYVGDATIGEQANIGAGTIFANYDGVNKHHTTIGDAAFVGSDTSLVAPVTVGDGAYVAAGSAIAKDVPPGSLGVTRAPQRNIEGWVARKRPGTKSAAAAERSATTPISDEPGEA